MLNDFPHGNFTVVNPDVKTAFGVGANPGFVPDL